jgi:hypothetical protein
MPVVAQVPDLSNRFERYTQRTKDALVVGRVPIQSLFILEFRLIRRRNDRPCTGETTFFEFHR